MTDVVEYEPDEAVCRRCGTTELVCIEKVREYRQVTYVLGDEGFDIADDSWGDSVGESYSVTIGVACQSCGNESEIGDDGWPATVGRVIVRREEFDATHPERPFRVERRRLVRPPEGLGTSGEYETGSVVVVARTVMAALEQANEHGMVDGRYPWRSESAEEVSDGEGSGDE